MSACDVCGKSVGFTRPEDAGTNFPYYEVCNHCGAERLISYNAMDEGYDPDSELSE